MTREDTLKTIEEIISYNNKSYTIDDLGSHIIDIIVKELSDIHAIGASGKQLIWDTYIADNLPMKRIYDSIGEVDNVPGYVWIHPTKLLTRAPSDPEILAIVIETLEAHADLLTVSPALTLEMLKPKLTDAIMTNIALTADPKRVWDRYLVPMLLMADMNVKVFAR